eukprot:SAG11_NODE_35838_length_264_cov_2.212121_1_plen_76_part_01
MCCLWRISVPQPLLFRATLRHLRIGTLLPRFSFATLRGIDEWIDLASHHHQWLQQPGVKATPLNLASMAARIKLRS